MDALEVIRGGHIIAGAVALAAFSIPLFTKKGGATHRRAGWVYAIAMWLAAVLAWGVCAIRLSDDDPSNDQGAIFLSFVGLLAAVGAATGIRMVRARSRKGASRSPFDIGMSSVLVVAALCLLVAGILRSSVLFIVFGTLGTFLGAGQLTYWLRPPSSKMSWWYEHMGNMLAACIGTVTAFLVVNVPRMGLQRYGLFFWITPGVVGGIGIMVWQRYYRRKFEPAETDLRRRGVQKDSTGGDRDDH